MVDRIARSRVDIDAARLVVCNAAIKIDESNAKGALKEIAEAKVLVPATLLANIGLGYQSLWRRRRVPRYAVGNHVGAWANHEDRGWPR